MSSCPCCDQRTALIPNLCRCAENYCPRCFLCVTHCPCTPAPGQVKTPHSETRDDDIPILP
jgi:hypothetical protein